MGTGQMPSMVSGGREAEDDEVDAATGAERCAFGAGQGRVLTPGVSVALVLPA